MAPLTSVVAIIDDHDGVRSATSSLVRSLGLSTATFVSAEEFLDAGTSEIGCLISDIQMAGMSGLELLATMNRRGSPPPTIIMTGHPTDQLRERAARLGAITLLEKPFSPQALVDALSVVFGSL